MILYLIKNNFKLMFRNKLAVGVLLIAPALTIALLSNAFNSLMKSYEAPDEFTVGYRENGSVLSRNMDTVKEAGKEAGIIFSEYPEGEPSELMINNDLSAFVEFGDGEYMLYKSGDHKPEGKVTEYFMERVISEGANAALAMMSPAAEMTSSVPENHIEYMPAIESNDYYGMIYILYFSCCGMICATGMLSSEKKNGIEKKYNICSVSPLGLHLARLLPTAGVIIVCTAIEAVITALIFDIHWGNVLLSSLIVLLMILAWCAFGFLIYSISQNLAITVIALFATVWVSGFFGGSFETYMFSSTSDTLKLSSPIYHANRALVELSCMGHSDYLITALIFSGSMIIVFSALSIAVDMIRKRGRA